ncbi:ABC transporter permease [Calderihabitans maritimus]|uniref:Diguanylate cyclase n=1 Tax=Calderihabitans maritimus TaxID=1246530 RepID=A0A1Z5HTJ5_9FIRM|nr:ABC transporter permease [Calderihabitans maritimus]GAW92863.1 diguanylate cyclase [Calderihabitans maritimus]
MGLSADMFEPIERDYAQDEAVNRPSMSYWQDAWRRFKKSRMAMVGLVIIGIMVIAAIVGPLLVPYTYWEQDLTRTNEPPSADHWFGTDALGRDLFVRVLYGSRISLLIGFISAFINMTIGVIYGGISGLFGGKIDNIMMRIVDILYSIPFLLVVILLMVVMGPGLKSVYIAFGLSFWLGMARIVRGQILSLREQEYVLAAQALGASKFRILIRHLIPNAMGPILVTVTLLIPSAIFTEAFLSFIGLGVSAPMASWGVLAADGYKAIRSYPWQLFFPAAAICITILAFNFVGDGLRDALDPRLRRD